MQTLHVVGIVYFVLLFVLINWKGRAFLELPLLWRTLIALAAAGLWTSWIVALHFTS